MSNIFSLVFFIICCIFVVLVADGFDDHDHDHYA